MKRIMIAATAALSVASAFAWPSPAWGTKANPAPTDGKRTWPEVKAMVEKTLKLCGKNEIGYYNDMGVLDLNGTLTAEEERTQLAVWAALASPMQTVGDSSKWRASTKKLLEDRDFQNVDQDFVGRQAYPVARKDGAMVLLKDCWGLNCNLKVATFYNPTDREVTFPLSFRDAEIDGEVTVKDVLDKTPDVKMVGSMTVKIPPHGAKTYRLFGKKALMRELYDIDSGLAGVQGKDVQFRHVYAPAAGDYSLAVAAAKDAAYAVQVNGLTVKAGCRGPVKVTAKLFKADNFVRLVSENDAIPAIESIRVTR